MHPHLIHDSVGPPESTTQTASRSVQPFLQGHDRDRQTIRQTDHATSSVTIGCIYVRSTAMRPKKSLDTKTCISELISQNARAEADNMFIVTRRDAYSVSVIVLSLRYKVGSSER